MNTNRKNTIRRLLAESLPYIPLIVLVGTVIGSITTFFQPDLRGVANCGSWKAPLDVKKEMKGKGKLKVELLKTMHTISVQNYGEHVIDSLMLTFRDAVYIEVQKNDDIPKRYDDRKSVPLDRLEPKEDTINIKVWTNIPASSRSEFEIKQETSSNGGEIADIHCVTPATATAAWVNKRPYISWCLILLFVYFTCGFLYLWLRPKLSKRGQTSPNVKNEDKETTVQNGTEQPSLNS